ncbi:putative ABC transporter ATP-binding protein [Blautia producta]|uniref:Putative ABC transporter ATP-binding protein n=1 Tax=Blautia producta TaxID=33035 RepID=A0A4P6LXI7_9FIRM|nr:ABC transporter ATP-binding protein [Blautia producta]QBE97311.1 putative ABC transporter ATP-binding protein [Blautia producta]
MVRKILKSLREYKKETILAPLFVTFEVIMECIIPFVMADLIDHMAGESITPVLKYGIALFIMALLSLLFGVLSGKAAATASCGLAKNIRQDLYFAVQDFAFADVDRFSTSSLVTRMTTDVTNLQNAFQMVIRIAVRSPLMIIFSFIMGASINVRIALIFLAIVPVLGIVLFGISYYVYPIFQQIFKKYDALNNSVQENISGIRVVKSFVREEYEENKFEKEAENVRADFTYVEKLLALNNPVMMFCIYLAILLVSFIGAKLIISSGGSSFTTGELSTMINYGVQILSSIMMLSMIVVMVTMASASAKRIAEVLDQKPSLTGRENGLTEVKNGEIIFKNVSFQYSKKSARKVLDHISLTIHSGETIGIIGGTGTSKSSLIQLIPRLYDVTEGEVLVGGVNVKDYDLESLRNEVAVVLQKNVLFSGTIKENLRWGNSEATDEELVRVCKLAQADEFISQFPDGYDTYIEQGGTNVSGGQKQRLCIARALLKKPKILILDDSTSAVDTKTDALIRTALREEIPHTTKIIIAQRCTSVEDADKILVLDGGKISGFGTEQELRENNQIYREVYESQMKGSH